MSAAAVSIPPAMPFPALDASIAKVRAAGREFAGLSIDDRISLLERMRLGYREIAEESVKLSCAAKGIDFSSPMAGEEWLGGPMVTIRVIRLTEEALREVKQYGAPRIKPSDIRDLPDGRIAVKVFPTNGFDSTLLAKHVGEVYMEKGVTRENLKDRQASFFKKPHQGRVCLVLGAGNVNAIPPTDVVYKMFVEGTACVLKMNPVNAYLGPLIERAFQPLVARGFLSIVYGGAEEGAYLAKHAGIDEIHITGSDKTHDAMVWGMGPDAAARRSKNEPLLTKAISSELGNISPVIVVPGAWDEGSLVFQAGNIAGQVCNNASFNCNSAKLLITSKPWSGRARLMELIESNIGKGGVRTAYYPGAEQRWKQFTDGRSNVKLVGEAKSGQLPYAIISGLDPNDAKDRVWSQEPWCTVLSETSFEPPDAAGFLEQAVKFVNEKVWGTLCATLIVHPSTLADPAGKAAVEQAIVELKYGSVVLNTWGGAVFGLGT
ncbi:MAG: Aldehyde dehydrogenase, partial [Myxococcaceae bacterium]|nr:Aldehyde dehydrogenase [Myxococcaceae bacterium]